MSNSIATPSFYADFEGLTSLKKNVKANDPQAIREAARQFESLFTDMMLKSMRAAKLGEGLGDSDQTDFYQDMYDQQLSVQMSQGKGLGLADMLIQQLTRSGAIQGTAAAGTAQGSASGSGAAATPAAIGSGGTVSPAVRSPQGNATGRGHAAASQQQRISFVQHVAPYAQQAASELGVSADALIAQAALETGWGQHIPRANGSSSNNLFGVKAGTATNAAVSAATTEYQQGAATRVNQSFRAYSSVQQGLNDYVTLLQRKPGFHAALGTGEDFSAFANALQRGGYATDPEYASKLLATARTVKQLRSGHTNAQLVAQSAAQEGPAATSAALKPADAAPITAGGDSV